MLHLLHRLSACLLGSYIAVHLCNHLLALRGVEAHIRFMEAFRAVYRHPLAEALLLGCVAFQIASGLYFLWRRRGQRHGWWERAQALSGAYLAFFLLVHVGAVLAGRIVWQLDTNFYFAAAGMHVPPYQLFFLPYYFLAVVAVFTHVAAAVRWLTRHRLGERARRVFSIGMLAIGITLASLIVAAFSGAFYEVRIPAEYRATFE